MNYLGDNQFYNFYYCKGNQEISSLPNKSNLEGSVVIFYDQGIISKSYIHMLTVIGQVFKNSINQESPIDFNNNRIMHAAIVTDITTDENDSVLNLVEAAGSGVLENQVKFSELSKNRKADTIFFFSPKSDRVRSNLKSLAKNTANHPNEKIPYNITSFLSAPFQQSTDFNSLTRTKIACLITDTLKQQQWKNIHNQIEGEICSSYVTLLLQASYVTETINLFDIIELAKMPRLNAVRKIFNDFTSKSIPDHLKCDSQLVMPCELYGRLLHLTGN